MKIIAFFVTSVALVLAFGCGAAPPPPEASQEVIIVPEGAELELLFTRSREADSGLTEGPAAAPDGSIYFTDLALTPYNGMIMRFDPATGDTNVFAGVSGKANGLAFDATGGLVAAEGADVGGRQISRWNIETGEKVTLADRYDSKRFNSPNDLVLDTKGRVYFTDPRYMGTEERELERMAIYRVDTEGTVIEVSHDFEKPNGLALSPDDRTLYVADYNTGRERRTTATSPPSIQGAMQVHAFPLDEDGLVAGPRRTLVDFGSEQGCDGMTVDEFGNIYLAARSALRPGIVVIDPDGAEVAFIATGPANQGEAEQKTGIPSNVEFGIGDESNVLYITVDRSLYRITLGVHGYQPF